MDAEVVDAVVVVKPSVANEPSLSTSKSIPKDTYLPENASQLLRYYGKICKHIIYYCDISLLMISLSYSYRTMEQALWYKWPSLHEYSEYLHDVKKDRVHGSFKIEIEILKKILSKDDPAQLRLAHLEGQLKVMLFVSLGH